LSGQLGWLFGTPPCGLGQQGTGTGKIPERACHAGLQQQRAGTAWGNRGSLIGDGLRLAAIAGGEGGLHCNLSCIHVAWIARQHSLGDAQRIRWPVRALIETG
jgi:hypothetical protein